MRRVIDTAAGVLAAVALAGSLTAVAVSLGERGNSIERTCAEVRELREDVAGVMDAFEASSILRNPDRAAEIRAFFGAQRARVQPVHCP